MPMQRLLPASDLGVSTSERVSRDASIVKQTISSGLLVQ